MPAPTEFAQVTVVCKANIYFEGRVISHTVKFSDGSKKTLGLIYPGSFEFKTDAAERMEMTAGDCRVRQPGQNEWKTYRAGDAFNVPAKSSFEIAVESGIAEYVCSFEPAR
ncbi:MAG TPA: pyrimidine/purine nucleoside phosphorylase [Terriglobia bacterium]|nr:pyrimidine/purine nucleoside phosphorylase [Terriglobia bacterium]